MGVSLSFSFCNSQAWLRFTALTASFARAMGRRSRRIESNSASERPVVVMVQGFKGIGIGLSTQSSTVRLLR
jgi:hypothetical protein